MDVQLKELIEKIKNDGVKSAGEQAEKIVAEAHEQASGIVRKAQEEADALKLKAQADAGKAERSGREALRQAGRDLLLSVRKEIESVFSRIIENETAGALDSKLLKDVIPAVISSMASGEAGTLEVPEKQLKELEKGLAGQLKESFSQGLEIRPSADFDAGFRVSRKDGSAFYDFSDKEIAAVLGRYLNPRLADLLTE